MHDDNNPVSRHESNPSLGNSEADASVIDDQDHTLLSTDCFNRAWQLIDKKDRTPEEDERMISLAHASLSHWRMRTDCTDRNLSIGYWQISHVYALLGQASDADRYGELCLQVSREEPPFYLAYAHESLARAAMLNKQREHFDMHLTKAKSLAVHVSDAAERNALEHDLEGLIWRE
jgi:hypothetical protein